MNMQIRNIATIYVFDGDNILLMHRVGSRLFQGSIWVGIGGHFEMDEMSDPHKCAMRELMEETGLSQNDVSTLKLKYITTRRASGEIRQQYIFVTDLINKSAELIESNEGRIHWVPLSELYSRKMAYSNTECLKHYLDIGKLDDNIYVGAVGAIEEGLLVQFTALKEYGIDK